MTFLSPEERLRIQAAVDASVPDPFDRPLTDEDRARVPQAWQQWQEDRIDSVRQQIKQEQLEEQKERARVAYLASLPTRLRR